MKTPALTYQDNFPMSSNISVQAPETVIPIHLSQSPLLNYEDMKVLDIGTLELWIRPQSSTTSEMCIFSINQGDLAFHISKDLKKAIIYLGKNRIENAYNFKSSQFHHICIQAKAGIVSINQGQTEFPISISDTSAKLALTKAKLNTLEIGHTSNSKLFGGCLLGLKLWAATLSSSEIKISADASSYSHFEVPLYSLKTSPSMTPGIGPDSLLGYLIEDQQGVSNFYYHYEATGSFIMESQSKASTLKIRNQEVEYVSFIGLVRDPKTAELVLVNDAQLYTYHFKPIGPNSYIDVTHPSFHLDIITGNNTTNGGYAIKLSGTIPDHGHLHAAEYVPSTPAIPDDGNNQTWGSVFAHRPVGSKKFLYGWIPFDKNYNYVRPGLNGNSDNFIFSEPSGGSKGYRKEVGSGGNVIAVQHGLFRVTENYSTGMFSSSFVSSVKDYLHKVVDGQDFSIGTSAGFMGLKAGPTFNYSHSTEKISQEITSQEKTLAIRQYLNMSYALILEKRSMQLDSNFVSHLFHLLDHPSKSNFNAFLDTYGTHYANAIIMGGRSFCTSSISKKAITKLMQEGTNVKLGLNYKAEVDIKGVEFSESASGSVHKGKTEATKLENSQGVELNTFETWGITSAFGNIPASPSSNIEEIVMADLKPLSNLLAPPFFNQYEIITQLRQQLHHHISLRAGSSQLNIGTRYITVDIKNIKAPHFSAEKVYWDIHLKTEQNRESILAKKSLKVLSSGKILVLAPMSNFELSFIVSSMKAPSTKHDVLRKDILGHAVETKDYYDSVEYKLGEKVKQSIHISESDSSVTNHITQKVVHHAKFVHWKAQEPFSPGFKKEQEDLKDFLIEFDAVTTFIDSTEVFTGIDTSRPLLNDQHKIVTSNT